MKKSELRQMIQEEIKKFTWRKHPFSRFSREYNPDRIIGKLGRSKKIEIKLTQKEAAHLNSFKGSSDKYGKELNRLIDKYFFNQETLKKVKKISPERLEENMKKSELRQMIKEELLKERVLADLVNVISLADVNKAIRLTKTQPKALKPYVKIGSKHYTVYKAGQNDNVFMLWAK